MVFQNPRDALNPRLRIAASISEPLRVHEPRIDSGVVRRKIEEAAELVLFPRGHLDRLPQELSAGEQQRAALARAIITRPALIVLDEPTSMLDASLRAGMVRTFADLQNALGVAFLLISHDFLTVAGLSHRIGVMYLGGIVELGATRDVLRNPIHPYSRALLGAIPVIAASQPPRAVVLQGEIPSPIDRPSGCPLVQRCPFAESRCGEQNPPLYELETGHTAACFVAADRLPKGEWEPVLTPGQVLAARIRTLATPQESTAPAASAIVAETVQTVEQPLLWER
jgi:oligopeptide/dipeptide ABC transporter ATP-binding protein